MKLRKRILLYALGASLCSAVVVKAVAPVIVLAEGVELILGAASTGVAGSSVATLATATSGGASALWSGVVASLGAAVIYAGFKAADNQVQFPIHSAHSEPPAPSAPSTAAAVTSGHTYTSNIDSTTGHTLDYVCSEDVIFLGQDYIACGGNYEDTTGRCRYSSATYAPTCAVRQTHGWSGTLTSCPSGYSNNVSGTCRTLENARAAVADAKCDVTRSGTTYSYASGDLDCVISGYVKGSISGDTWTLGGVDQYGNPVEFKVKALANGATQISQSVATKINGNDVITEKTVQLDSSGVPVSNQQTQRPGTIVPSLTDQTVTKTDAPTGSTLPPTSITFPNDYNRESTQQDIKTDIHSMVTSSSVSDPTPATGTSDVAPLLFVSTFTNLLAWSLPSHSSTCPAPTITAFETDYTFNTHCTIAASLGTDLQTSFALVWLLVAMFIVLSA